jgi:MFS family permease
LPAEPRQLPLWPVILVLILYQMVQAACMMAVPIMAPVLAVHFGVGPELAGLYGGLVWVTSPLAIMVSGGMVSRFGAARVLQFGALCFTVGLLVGAGGWLWMLALCAMLSGLGAGPETTASTSFLLRLVPPARRPTMFSIKQIGVPLGAVILGLAIPWLLAFLSWQAVLAVFAACALAMALVLEWIRRIYEPAGGNAVAARPLGLVESAKLSVSLASSRKLLPLSVFGLTLSGMQLTVTALLVSRLVNELGYSIAFGGLLLAVMQASVVAGRLFWSMVAAWVPTRFLLVGSATAMTACTLCFGIATTAWPEPALWAVALTFGFIGNVWNGFYIAELAAAAPPDRTSEAIAGMGIYGVCGAMVLPAAFGLLAQWTGIGVAIAAAAIPGVIGVALLFRR